MRGELSLQPLSTEHLFEGSQGPDGTLRPQSQSFSPATGSLVRPPDRSWLCQTSGGWPGWRPTPPPDHTSKREPTASVWTRATCQKWAARHVACGGCSPTPSCGVRGSPKPLPAPPLPPFLLCTPTQHRLQPLTRADGQEPEGPSQTPPVHF